MYTLVLLRHGESTWNRENRFTGWTDVDLTDQGRSEAKDAGRLLKAEGFDFDLAFTSVLRRAIRTLWIALDEMDRMWIPVTPSWRLNERHYGALQGLDKAETAAQYGDAQVLVWRRSYDTPPNPLTPDDPRSSLRDPRYAALATSEVPLTECLKDTVARVLPFWNDSIAPAIRSGRRVLITAHGNSLRALIKHLDGIGDDEIVALNVPTGRPLVYELDENLKPIGSRYLGDPEAIAQAMAAVAAQGKAKRRPESSGSSRLVNCSLRALLCALAMFSLPATGIDAAPARSGVPAKKANRPPPVPGPSASPDPQQEQTMQAAERDRLNARIAELKKQIAAGERSRSGATAALARAEHALADVTRRLDELAGRQRVARELVASLERQRAGTDGEIASGQVDLDRATRQLYAHGERDPLKTWLSGGDPSDGRLTRAYLGYVIRADTDSLASLQSKAVDLQARRQRADDEDRLLLQQAEAQKSAREALTADQSAQRQALADLSKKLAEQRNTAVALENDEKRLGRVIEQLQRVIRERELQAAAERARRETARRAAEQQAAAKARQNRTGIPGRTEPPAKAVPDAPVVVDAVPDDAAGNGAFAQLRGHLRLPVRGSITGRYGSPRGGGGATWKGVFVRTESGAEVRAVAAGRVIFSDELRGFGNLLIVDHGNQYLSIYANNDSLLRHTGDSVKPGDVVSRAGNSSGDDQTGLYFELRFQGRPFDPMTWIGGR